MPALWNSYPKVSSPKVGEGRWGRFCGIVKMEEGEYIQLIGWLAEQSCVSDVYFPALGGGTSLRSAFQVFQAHPSARTLGTRCRNDPSPPGGTTCNEVCAPFTKSSSFMNDCGETKTGQTFPSQRSSCFLLPIGLSSICWHTDLTALFYNNKINHDYTNDTFTFLYHFPVLNAF